MDKEYSKQNAVLRAKRLSKKYDGEFVAYFDDDYNAYMATNILNIIIGAQGVMEHEIVAIFSDGKQVN